MESQFLDKSDLRRYYEVYQLYLGFHELSIAPTSFIEVKKVSGFLTWLTFRFGSPVITVRALKSTRFPIRFPRTRPSLAFRRSEIDFSGRPDFCIALGTPGNVLSYQLDITWLYKDQILQFYQHLSSNLEILYISRRDKNMIISARGSLRHREIGCFLNLLINIW